MSTSKTGEWVKAARRTLAVDPFLGLGSSAVAGAKLGINFAGIEIDEHCLKEPSTALAPNLELRNRQLNRQPPT